MDVVAEGIETLADEEQLKAQGCRFVQGYRYARPMPASKVVTWLKHNRRAA